MPAGLKVGKVVAQGFEFGRKPVRQERARAPGSVLGGSGGKSPFLPDLFLDEAPAKADVPLIGKPDPPKPCVILDQFSLHVSGWAAASHARFGD